MHKLFASWSHFLYTTNMDQVIATIERVFRTENQTIIDLRSVAIILLVCVALYVLVSPIVRWLTKQLFANPYNHRMMAKQDLKKRQKTLSDLMVNIWRMLVVVGGLYAIARVYFSSSDLAPLFASAGIIGVALGFGAQSLVRDFLSGLFIISENQYRVGDVIDIDGFGGTVERIGTRSTVLRDVDGNVHYFPNGIVQHVINKTMGFSKARFVLSLTPDSDLDRAIEIINATGEALAKEEEWERKIIEAPSFVMISDVTATAVNLIVSGTTQPSDQWSVAAEMRRRILEQIETEKNIELGLVMPAGGVVAPPPKQK